MSLKQRISSPLEAGTSILDAHHLPPHVHAAVEYAAERLARKSLHVSLVVMRRSYQVLTTPASSSTISPDAAVFSSPVASPSSLPFRGSFTSTIKNLVRSRAHPLLPLDRATRQAEALRSTAASPAFSPCSSAGSTHSASTTPRWPVSPLSPLNSPAPLTPATTITTASSVTTDAGCAAAASQSFGLRLVYASAPQPRQEKVIRSVMEKTGRRFGLGPEWLSAPSDPAALGLTDEVVARSVAQNEILFCAGGLTLLSADHLYTFKAALAAYAARGTGYRLEDAVDELRRYVLAHAGRGVPRGHLVRAYDGLLGLSDKALRDVQRMYARAYGGLERDGGIEPDALAAHPPATLPPTPPPKEEAAAAAAPAAEEEEEELPAQAGRTPSPPTPEEMVAPMMIPSPVSVASATPRMSPVTVVSSTTPRTSPRTSPAMKNPALKLQTTFGAPAGVGFKLRRAALDASQLQWNIPIHIDEATSPSSDIEEDDDEESDERAQLTARPGDGPKGLLSRWGVASLDEVLLSPDDDRNHHLGPMTPKDYDDISPITRGEWGFLVGGQLGRQVAVTTF